TVTHIAHLNQNNLNLYSGNYSDFENTRAQETLQQSAAYNQQQQKIKELTRFIDRFRAKATKAKQAQSRLKTLERMARIPPVHMNQGFEFAFNTPGKMPDPLLRLDEISVGYNGYSLIENVNLSLRPGDRYGLIGPNGAGKSTLIKLLANKLSAIKGQRITSPYLVTGYFAQHQIEQIDPEASPLMHLMRIDPEASEQSLRDYLGMFSFSNETALGRTRHFSGGEKARLVFAMLCYRKPNLLLLDEPTNHLDLDMRRALAMALNQYPGAVVLVSHDRYLINSICDSTLLINNGKAEPFEGDQADYARWLASRSSPGINEDRRESSSTALMPPSDTKTAKEKRRQTALRRKQLKLLVDDVKYEEQKLERLTAEKAGLMNKLADTTIYNPDQSERLKQLLEQQANLEKALQCTESAWLRASEKLEQADQQFEQSTESMARQNSL
ncbi:ATP-binding cassette domain-containing protein, partial [Acidihalobacter prosperus]